MYKESTQLVKLGRGAFHWEPRVVEPLLIDAVVVDHVLRLHPHQRGGVEPLVEPRRLRRLVAAPGDAWGGHARRDAEVAVVGVEWRLRPVCLDAAALRRPLLGVPQAPLRPHALPRRERHAARPVVLVRADRRVVDEEPAEKFIGDGGEIERSEIEAV
jgi:hypothetical protein